ncbi:tumor necrosis factor receptor superfamily member 9-like [Heterodontus francisci]|uniref:tumor necrosis factor receptor superfamily member 9-like n=1 Tax=Heterodontus francisci TaxID=7792 RepID=UPI00355BB28D
MIRISSGMSGSPGCACVTLANKAGSATSWCRRTRQKETWPRKNSGSSSRAPSPTWSQPLQQTDKKICEKNKYYNTEVNRCCSKCPPGSYRKSRCTFNQDTVCESCKPNSYNEEWTNSYGCIRCVGTCGNDLRQVQSCSPTTRQICECQSGMFCKSPSQDYCSQCVHHKRCGVGEELIKKGTSSQDNDCKPCPVGTFSAVQSDSAKCLPHTNCSQLNKHLVKEGTTFEDVVCGDVTTSTTATNTLTISSQRPNTDRLNLTTLSTAVTTPKENRQMVDLFLTIGLLLALLLILIVSSLLFRRKEYFKSLFSSNRTKGSVYIVTPCTVYVEVDTSNCANSSQEDSIVKLPDSHIHFPQQESVKSQNARESHVFPVEEEGKLFRDPVPAADY